MSNIKALLVGVCEYSALGLQELPLCKNDVLALKHALILGLNAKESNINICGTNGIVSSKDLIEELERFVVTNRGDGQDGGILFVNRRRDASLHSA